MLIIQINGIKMKLNKKFFKNKKIFITGGTGTFGTSMIKKLLKEFNIKKITVYSRDEMKQWYLRERLNSKKINFVLGDVRDKERLTSCMEGHDYVFHAAATKIVPTSEFNPEECIKTNIIGAMNVIDASKNTNIKKVVALSTDKASSPINLYGATKLCSDKLFVSQNAIIQKKTTFGVVRYGNVMASRGSIIPYFKSLKKEKSFPITHLDMTRFFLTIEDAVEFSCFCMQKMLGGEIFVKKIKSINITDLAKSIKKNAKFKITGIRPGEKIHEQMIGSDESINTAEFNEHYEILPNLTEKKLRLKRGGNKVRDDFIFSSKTAKKFTISEFSKFISLIN